MRPYFGRGIEGHLISCTVTNGVVVASPAQGIRGTSGVDIVSEPVPMHDYWLASIQAIATGSVDGAWSVEWSNNYSRDNVASHGQPANAGDWVVDTSTGSTPAAPGGDGQNDMAELPLRAARHLRVRFTPDAASGHNGTIDLWLACK